MDIAAAKKRCEASSPGPWEPCAHVAGTDPDCPCKYYGDVWGEDGETIVAFLGTCSVCPGDGCGCRTAPAVHDEMQRQANGMFIAHARADLPAALEALEEAQKIADILRPTMNLGVVQAPTPIEDTDRLYALKDAVAALDRILRGSKEDE